VLPLVRPYFEATGRPVRRIKIVARGYRVTVEDAKQGLVRYEPVRRRKA
jgi:hypothetical protein